MAMDGRRSKQSTADNLWKYSQKCHVITLTNIPKHFMSNVSVIICAVGKGGGGEGGISFCYRNLYR